ncbi:family 43 glycosylhydrolase [Catenovulum maritimum]|uniref:Beta-xylosidase n=1 Tax=Catenovulum maritimum TaxID=1513271 RepID=A0A0J8GX46_9ALTE|nr:family 43 glycosylhydrolase [Catenovulum maritimum]KMT65283.1 hypothetical protein XM47_09620 [Catenovulum maritimum]
MNNTSNHKQSSPLTDEFIQQIKSKNYIALTPDEKRKLVLAHQVAFQALDEKIRDPFITKGPDNFYYLTGTTAGSHWGDTVGVRLWRSKDLANWQDLGFVWQLNKEGKAQNSWHHTKPVKRPDFINPVAIWAPEIHYMKGTWWIPHCINGGGHGLLKSKTGLVQGPYEALPAMMDKLIDAHLFKEGEDIYYAWQADYIAKMNSDMTALAEPATKLQHNGKHEMAYEGILIIKFGDKYLHIGSGRYGYEPSDSYDLFYAVSNNLKGPYGKRRMMIKNAGHGNIFKGPNGKWWSTAFDHEYTTKFDQKNKWSLWLVPIDIKETEKDIIVDVKDARFTPTPIDQYFIDRLSVTGKPKAWHGIAPWTKPNELEAAKTQKAKHKKLQMH